MSFILDALKRSERERRPRRAHDFGALYESEPEPRRPKWLWAVLIAALAINLALVVSFLLWPDRTRRETAVLSAPPVSPAPVQEPPQAPVPQTHQGAIPPGGILPKPGANAPPAPSGAAGTKAPPLEAERPSVSQQDSPRVRPLYREAAVTEVHETRPPEPPERPSRLPAAPVSLTGKPSFEIPRPEAPSAEPRAHSKDVPPAPAVASQAGGGRAAVAEPPQPTAAREAQGPESREERIPLVTELPPGVGEKLKALQINVHAYYDDPAQRYVFINMRRYSPGDRIGRDGPTLESITPDGVILNYEGGKALLQTRK